MIANGDNKSKSIVLKQEGIHEKFGKCNRSYESGEEI